MMLPDPPRISQFPTMDDLREILAYEPAPHGLPLAPGVAEAVERAARSVLEKSLAWQGKPFLTAEEFAGVIGGSLDTVRTLMRSRQIPVARFGSRLVVPVQAYLQWLSGTTEYPRGYRPEGEGQGSGPGNAEPSFVVRPRTKARSRAR